MVDRLKEPRKALNITQQELANRVGIRLKELRKALNITQQELANRVGMKQNTIATYEIERAMPSDLAIRSICREFNVNEDWLRSGNGEMFLPIDRNVDIAKLTRQLLDEEDDSFKNRFISMLANLTVEEWESIERKAKYIVGAENVYQ